ELFVSRPAARCPEAVDGDDVRETTLQSTHVGLDLPSAIGPCAPPAAWHRLEKALRVCHDLAVVRVPGGAKQRLDLGVGQAIHEVGLADRSLPAAGHDLPHLPLEVFDRLVRAGEDIDRVLDGDRAETLQPGPQLDTEVVGFGWDLVG